MRVLLWLTCVFGQDMEVSPGELKDILNNVIGRCESDLIDPSKQEVMQSPILILSNLFQFGI